MKKLLGILIVALLLVPTQVKAGPIGSGEIKLKPQAVQAWINYVKQRDKPRIFLVPVDGSSASSWYCPQSVTCVPGGATQEILQCERHHGKQCKIFARGRTIKWKNGINKGNRESKFNSKWSDAEIRAKLTELGFFGEATSTTTKAEKKKETKKKTNEDIVQKLKDLKELYDDGALTKEEYTKAKNKLLN